ncbi:MAG: ATP-dependent zinc metalloprotease FtsH [Flavobacteriales bacterium]|nr:ATP-dependent zinc metalloprotease FtsH [Flavobacteriales bacterium]
MEKKNDNRPQPSRSPQGRRSPFGFWWVSAMIVVAILGIEYFYSTDTTARELSQREFFTEVLPSGDVREVVVYNQDYANVFLTSDALKSGRYKDRVNSTSPNNTNPHFKVIFVDAANFEKSFNEVVDENSLDVLLKKEVPSNTLGNILSWLPFILMIGFFIFMMTRMGGAGGGGSQVFNIGKSKARVFDENDRIKVTFENVAGLEGAKEELQEIVNFLREPGKYTRLGGKIPKGALLVGPPGTGKTLLAKAVAGEANVPFFSISGSDFVEMFVGVGASRVRDLFRQAKEKAPCIVFIDEIDAIGRARSKNAGYSSNDERENTLNQLLTEMDGFATNAGVIILAATNRADILDKALMRAGRFDRQIHVELPDLTERRDIFEVHLKRLKLDPNLDREFLAKHTPGFSGADIANVCNEAALIAARGNKTQVERQDFLDAIDRIVGGLERRSTIISDQEKRSIAFHEAGHATVSWLLRYANPLIKVTIIPRGRALGAAWYLPDERHITTKEQLLDEMAATLGGRAAEEIFLGRISTGALNDLERVTRQAYAMISYFGMSDSLGNMSYYDSTGRSDMGFAKPYSDKTAQQIDSEVKALIDSTYQKAKTILEEHRAQMEQLAEKLLDKEVIFTEDVEEILGKRPFGTTPEGVKPETEPITESQEQSNA